MSKVLKLNKSQIKMLKEFEEKKVKKIIITEDQAERLLKNDSKFSNRISKTFKSEFKKAGSDIKTEGDMLGHPVQGDGSDYTPQSVDQNKKTTASFNESENKPDMRTFATNLLEYLRNEIKGNKTCPKFFKENGISRKKLKKALRLEKVVRDSLIGEDRTIKLNKDIGSSIKRMYERFFPGDFELNESSGYPAGAANDSRAPYNQDSRKIDAIQPSERRYTELFTDSRTSIFTDGKNHFYFDFQDKDDSDFEEYVDREYTVLGKDEDGDYDIEYGDYEVDSDVVERFVNDNYGSLNNGKGPSKEVVGYNAMHDGDNDFVLLDDEGKKEYLSWFKNDKKSYAYLSKLFGIELEETTTAGGGSSGQYTAGFSATPKPIDYGKSPAAELDLYEETPFGDEKIHVQGFGEFEMVSGDMNEKGEHIVQLSNEEGDTTHSLVFRKEGNVLKIGFKTNGNMGDVSKFIEGEDLKKVIEYGKNVLKSNVNEVDYKSATPKHEIYIVWNDKNGELQFDSRYSGSQLRQFLKSIPDTWDIYHDRKEASFEYNRRKEIIDRLGKYPKFNEPLGETTTTASSGSYSTPKIWAKSKKDHIPSKKPTYPKGEIVENNKNFQTDTSYPEGEFVEFDKCVRIGNNDKTAINGGCSQGAVDGVVKTNKSKKSVISKEALYYEVAKKTGKKVEEVRKIIEKNSIK